MQDLELDLFTMSNLSPKKTGLPFVVWISPRGNARHDLRIKVSRSPKAKPEDFITVAVRPLVRVVYGTIPASELKLLREWITLNRETLLAFWNGDIEYTEDVLRELKPIVEGQ